MRIHILEKILSSIIVYLQNVMETTIRNSLDLFFFLLWFHLKWYKTLNHVILGLHYLWSKYSKICLILNAGFILYVTIKHGLKCFLELFWIQFLLLIFKTDGLWRYYHYFKIKSKITVQLLFNTNFSAKNHCIYKFHVKPYRLT